MILIINPIFIQDLIANIIFLVQVSRSDSIRKEVIQQLCIEPMTHSQLNKSLVENVNLETGLEIVINDVANQKELTPQRTSVVYELKPGLFFFKKKFDIW